MEKNDGLFKRSLILLERPANDDWENASVQLTPASEPVTPIRRTCLFEIQASPHLCALYLHATRSSTQKQGHSLCVIPHSEGRWVTSVTFLDYIWGRSPQSHRRFPIKVIVLGNILQKSLKRTSYGWFTPLTFTKLIRIVHILVSSYTASNPWLTDWARSWANSWLLKIFRLQPLGILQTVVGWNPWW